MWSFGRALIPVNRPQSCSMLKGQLEMTGCSANYFLGKRLFCALKGDVNLAEDCFCRCSAPLTLTGTQHSLFIGILEPVCLSCYTIECIDFVTKLVKHAFHQSTKEQLRQCATEALSSGGKKEVWVKLEVSQVFKLWVAPPRGEQERCILRTEWEMNHRDDGKVIVVIWPADQVPVYQLGK